MYNPFNKTNKRYTFASEDLGKVWDAIVIGFLASNDWECELIDVPENAMLDGHRCVNLKLSIISKRDNLVRAIRRNNLSDKLRVRISKKKGGHVWLQKVGAENHWEILESEKIAPWWTPGSPRGSSIKKTKKGKKDAAL